MVYQVFWRSTSTHTKQHAEKINQTAPRFQLFFISFIEKIIFYQVFIIFYYIELFDTICMHSLHETSNASMNWNSCNRVNEELCQLY